GKNNQLVPSFRYLHSTSKCTVPVRLFSSPKGVKAIASTSTEKSLWMSPSNLEYENSEETEKPLSARQLIASNSRGKLEDSNLSFHFWLLPILSRFYGYLMKKVTGAEPQRGGASSSPNC